MSFLCSPALNVRKAYIPKSKRVTWETPDALFKGLDREFHFTLDAAASRTNRKCARFYDQKADGLSKLWLNEVVWCNPPYGRVIAEWVKHASKMQHRGTTTVMLVPARTDTAWFHDYCYKKPHVEVRLMRGRVTFKGAKAPAPFPCMLVVFHLVNHAPFG